MRRKLVACALISAMLAVFPLVLTGIEMHANPNPQTFLLLVIDFDDFMCPACMDSVLDFCRALSGPLQKKLVWGVVVCDRLYNEGKTTLSERILEKKIRGFVRANHLVFPILLDRDGIFVPFVEDGTAIFVFDGEKQTISRHIFPLAPAEIRIIRKSVGTSFRD